MRVSRKAPIQAPFCFIQGIYTHVVTARYSGSHHLFGIRLHPHAVKGFLNISSKELRNRSIDATLIKPEFRIHWNQLGEAKTFRERVTMVEKIFRMDSEPECSRSAAMSEIFYTGEIDYFKSVDHLAQKVCYSSRHLNRKSHELFGLSAEELVRYKKFMCAVNRIHYDPSRLVDIALKSGFYDQPHFNKVFKTYTGFIPKEYRSQKSDLPFHLFQ
jgi:AraC-like DNA-binding protein